MLVDELAHTNAPGSRHPKRYLDVEEILAAGIDVYTTLNIQHIESLNDVVAQITRIRVRETVPDNVLDRADEIELVGSHRRRAAAAAERGQGLCAKAQAERALRHYFSPGNITALRELALRRTAQRVDRADGRVYAGPCNRRSLGRPASMCWSASMSTNPPPSWCGADGVWPNSFKASVTVIYVEASRHLTLSEVEKDRVADTMRLAQRLGAEALTLPGREVANTILDYARAKNVTQILIGKSERSRWFELLHGSVVRDLMRDSGAISITAVMAEGDAVAPKTVKTASQAEEWPWDDYAKSAGAVAVTVAIAWLFNAALSHALGSIGMLFLVPVLLSAVSFGLRPALFAAFFSALCYNFFFLPPLYTFTIADPNNVLSFGVLLFVAVIAGNLAARVRAQADLAARRAAVAGELFNFTGKVAGLARLDDILWAVSFQIASMLKCNVVILLPNRATGQLEIRGAYPPEDELSADDIAAATWCWERGQASRPQRRNLAGRAAAVPADAHGRRKSGRAGAATAGRQDPVHAG